LANRSAGVLHLADGRQRACSLDSPDVREEHKMKTKYTTLAIIASLFLLVTIISYRLQKEATPNFNLCPLCNEEVAK
jgi:hypothetical protein